MGFKTKQLLEDGEDAAELDIRINDEYARRFEHNKRREEWQRLQERNPALAAKLQRQAEAAAFQEVAQGGRRLTAAAAGGDEDLGEDADDDEEEDSSEDEEPDPEELVADTDKVLETLLRIRRQDPAIYQPDVYFFPPDEDQQQPQEAGASGKATSGKPMYLRTMLAQQALAGEGQDADNSSGDEAADGSKPQRGPDPRSYVAEQDELRKAFLQAAEEAGARSSSEGEQEEAEGDKALAGVLRKRKRDDLEEEEGAAGGAGKDQQVKQLLEEYFGRDDEQLSEADRFLKSFIANKGWVDKGEGPSRLPTYQEVVGEEEADQEGMQVDGVDLEEDEQFLEAADRYEAEYNFRFEEPGAARIVTHPRIIGDSVRKADEKRKRQREARAARKAAERAAQEEELKRMKNLKKSEIEQKLREVQKVAGLADDEPPAAAAKAPKPPKGGAGGMPSQQQLLAELMAEDFDPEEYDRRMAAAFDDAYYEMEEDADELFGDGEEQVAAPSDLELSEEEEGQGGEPQGWKALRQKLKEQQQQQQQPDGQDSGDSEGGSSGSSSGDETDGDGSSSSGSEGEDEGQQETEEQKQQRRAALAEGRSRLQQLLEEYYKLDYEDNIAGIPCRFRYREVPKSKILSADEILRLDDKELNQIMSLKKLAPYRDDAGKVRPNYKALQAAKQSLPSQPKWKKQKQGENGKQRQWQDRAGWAGKPAWQLEHGRQQHQQDGPGWKRQHQGGNQKGFSQQNGFSQQRPHKHQGSGPYHQRQREQPGQVVLDDAAKQQARLASYAKLSLKRPNTDDQQQQQQHSDRRQQRPGRDNQQQPRLHKRQKQEEQPKPQLVGRLAKAAMDTQQLTPAQKKNLKRALKRKEAKGDL